MALRVLYQSAQPRSTDQELVSYAEAVRKEPGCLEVEVYRNIEAPESVSCVQLWEDQYQYAAHWGHALESAAGQAMQWANPAPRLDGLSGAEFYNHSFYYPDRVWYPVAHREQPARIFWPAREGIRIIGQMGTSGVDAKGAIENALETRREPGCIQFDWNQNIEAENEILLLELWSDQAIYDAHWNLRIKTGAGRGAGGPGERRNGPSGIEFYRHQAFIHLYDRWLPADVRRWSETVIWPD